MRGRARPCRRHGQRERRRPAPPCAGSRGRSASGGSAAASGPGRRGGSSRRNGDRARGRVPPPDEQAGDSSDAAASAQGLEHRPRLDHLAEVDRLRLLERLPDRRLAQRRRAEPVVVRAEIRRNCTVLASRSFSPGQRSSIRSAMSRSPNRTTSGREHVAVEQPARRARSGRPGRPAGPRESRWISQSARPASDDERDEQADHPAQPVQGQQPPDLRAKRRDPRFQDDWASSTASRPARRPGGRSDPRFPNALRGTLPKRNYTICLRFLKTHSAVISTRNSARTGQVFQSGIGGSVSRGTFCGLGRSLSRVAAVSGV